MIVLQSWPLNNSSKGTFELLFKLSDILCKSFLLYSCGVEAQERSL